MAQAASIPSLALNSAGRGPSCFETGLSSAQGLLTVLKRMKSFCILSALLLSVFAGTVHAQIYVEGDPNNDATSLPGSALDFAFFGSTSATGTVYE
jgi:hypothetical protein